MHYRGGGLWLVTSSSFSSMTEKDNFITTLCYVWRALKELLCPLAPCSAGHPSSVASQGEFAFCWALILPSHCWGEQMASHSLELYFLATCLKLQLPDMANEFYNQKLKWISCSRCFFSGNYQTFLAAHLSFKRIKLCTSIMRCHWSIAQLYQTFFFNPGNWINFQQRVFFLFFFLICVSP